MDIYSTVKGLFGQSISIEFSIVSVITTVVLVYAAPIYSDYMVRTKVLEAIQLAEPMKFQVHSFVSTEGRLPEPTDTTGSESYIDHPAKGILSIGLFGLGKIGIVTDDLGGDAEYGQQIWLIPELTSSSIIWHCTPGRDTPAFPTKYLPRSCSS